MNSRYSLFADKERSHITGGEVAIFFLSTRIIWGEGVTQDPGKFPRTGEKVLGRIKNNRTNEKSGVIFLRKFKKNVPY